MHREGFEQVLMSRYRGDIDQVPRRCRAGTEKVPMRHRGRKEEVPMRYRGGTKEVPSRYRGGTEEPRRCQAGTQGWPEFCPRAPEGTIDSGTRPNLCAHCPQRVFARHPSTFGKLAYIRGTQAITSTFAWHDLLIHAASSYGNFLMLCDKCLPSITRSMSLLFPHSPLRQNEMVPS